MSRILLVEDNELNRDMLSRRLKKRGFEIEIAIDGQQGIDMARAGNPKLILLDMSLPVVDGWDAARTLKSGDDTKDIPIIALTAHAMAGDREKALEAGCDDYDTKPVELPRLLEKISKWIEG
ncbi:response regulator [Actibacterium pelagium]|uniref:Response regulator n=1 Tax=Actibacterium pelagium TaxID=2029103 RepID=A0A917AHH0_9RHOB|nr:response regulator [Actibacterium pelagium]GGE48807.1 response regulator [Actibacterium pelagium]